MKSKAIVPLVLGAVVGLAAIKLLVDTVQRAQGQTVGTVKTVTALMDIPASYAITEDMVTVVDTPASPLVPEGGFDAVESVIGRVTSKSIPLGAVVAPQSLAPPGTMPGLTERIEEGYRAVSVKIDEVSGVAGQIMPGDFVDVIVVMNLHRGSTTDTISRIILQRVQVLAVGQNLSSNRAEEGKETLARSVTLLIRDGDVPKLHLAQSKGMVTLAMRGADDRLLGEEEQGFASTMDWLPQDEKSESASTEDDAGPLRPKSPGERLALALGRQVNEAEEDTFEVAVFNGPLVGGNNVAVQRVTYAGRESMKVLKTESGRSGGGRGNTPDSAESIMRGGSASEDDDVSPAGFRLPGRQRLTDAPKDREIADQ